MTPTFGAAVLRAWVAGAVDGLEAVQHQLDTANVFPVADGDTGTNMLLTFRDGAAALPGEGELPLEDGPGPRVLLEALAHGCARGARGNSGVILAEWVRGLLDGGLAEGMSGFAAPRGIADALAHAASNAHAAVAEPVEGTMLTAATSAARHALRAAREPGATVPSVLTAATGGAIDAHARSMTDLDLLASVGVRDAGAHGLVVVLAALAAAVGSPVERLHDVVSVPSGTILPDGERGGHEAGGEFEVMMSVALSEASEAPGAMPDLAGPLRDALAKTGGSVAVVGAAPLWRGHVHTDEPVAALAAARGVADRVGVRAVDDPTRAGKSSAGAMSEVQVRHIGHGAPRPGAVAVCAAPGILAEVARAGAVVLVPDDSGRVAPEALRRARDECGVDPVVLGPPAVLGGTDVPGLVDAPTDLHVVAALGALATTALSADGRRVELERVVAAVRTVVLHVPRASCDGGVSRSIPGLDELLEPSPSEALVLVLHGAGADVDRVHALIAARNPAAEVVTLASGLDDDAVLVGLDGSGVDGSGAV